MKYLFYFVLLLSTVLKVLPALDQKMQFTMDQGRDLIDVRQIWEQTNLRLIGPTTSINGVYLGPFYYYLISIPYLLTSGNPLSILIWQIVLFQAAAWYLWFTLRRENKLLSSMVGIFLLISPVGFYTARHFWNANFMPIFTVLFLALLYQVLNSHNPKKDFFLGIVAGLSLQIEAAFGILFLPFAIMSFKQKNAALPKYSRLISGFLITLIPQIIFEIKNHFVMTKVLIGELTGKTSILGETISFLDRFSQRVDVLNSIIRETSLIPYKPFVGVLAVCLLFFIFHAFTGKKDGARQLTTIGQLSFNLTLFSIIFYSLYSSQVKAWYVYGLTTSFVIFLAATLTKMLLASTSTFLFAFIVILSTTFYGIRSQADYVKVTHQTDSGDPSGFNNQLQVIDDIYKSASNKDFKVYNYLPSVYDYPFQYLFWWYGLRKYGYSPSDLSYLPNQPEYIINKDDFLKNSKPESEDSKTFLIIQEGENKKHFFAWQGSFTHLCLLDTKEYPFNQRLITLQKCP